METQVGLKITEKLVELINKANSVSTNEDKLFSTCKEKALLLAKDFSENPYRDDLVERSSRIISSFDQIEFNKNNPNDYEIGRTASAVVAGRVRRTHFAAYTAGQYRNDNKVGFKYKNWMHNIAANGALSLHECITDILDSLQLENEIAKKTIEMFSFAAKEDAKLFLNISEQIDPTSCLTIYNQAKLSILSGNTDFIAHGIDRIENIDTPNQNDHIPDLRWHIDNFDSFKTRDNRLRKLVEVHFEHRLDNIRSRLETNSDKARTILNHKSDEENPQNYNKLAIAATGVGTTITALLYFKPEIADLMKEILEVAMMHFDASETVSAGDGGLPFSTRAAQIAFGDGGLPFTQT